MPLLKTQQWNNTVFMKELGKQPENQGVRVRLTRQLLP